MKKAYNLVFVLVICVGLISILSISLAYFNSVQKTEGYITLGEVDFTLLSEFEENMFALPNSKLNCFLTIKNEKENGKSDNLIPVYFRFKIAAESDNNIVEIHPLLNEDWFINDNFFYYKNVLQPGDFVNICEKVLIDKNTSNNVQGKGLEINLLFEAIQYNAALDIWGEIIANNLTNL